MLNLQRISSLRRRVGQLARMAPYAGTGVFTLLLSNVRILGGLSPFGAAFAMAMPSGLSFSSVIGGILGCSFFGRFEKNIPYLIAFLCVLAFKLAAAGHPKFRSSVPVLCGASFGVLALSLGMGTVLNGEGAVGFFIRLAESALGGAMTYFSIQALRAAEDLMNRKEPGEIREASLFILLLVTLVGACGVEVWFWNLGRVLGGFFLLWLSGRRGMAAGAVGGVAVGAAICLAGPESAACAGGLALSAMLCGVFAKFGRLTQTAVFLSVFTVSLLVLGELGHRSGGLDMLAASALFLALPTGVYQKLRQPVSQAQGSRSTENRRISAQMDFAARTIRDIRDSVDAVSKRLNRLNSTEINDVYDRVADRVCGRCGLKMFCWETAFSQTTEAFQRLTPLLKEHGRIYPEDLPKFFQTKCPKTGELVRGVNGCYQEFIARENAGRKVLGAKQVAMEQLDGVAEMLRDAGEDLSEGEEENAGLARTVSDFLAEIGEDADEVYCVLDRYDRMRLEIYREKPFRCDRKLLAEQLSGLLERPFDAPCVVSAGGRTRVSFFEKARFALQFALRQKSAEEGPVCGDCCEYFADPRGYAHIIISDGMGSGSRAAVDSVMTCNFALKLIKAGFQFDAALKFINSALLVKAGDESLATLDIGCIDLYTGEAEFLKAGGACSFLCRDGHTMQIKGPSLPAGILQGIQYDRHKVKLREGDLLVMVTDGAVAISEDWLAEEISALDSREPGAVAEKLLQLASFRQQGKGDDITVAAARLVYPAE
ncbi:MAG TPA: SpoIIE family protein phosphatase [Candidatus Merdivicinus intestinigallinarum]|nr:SpoIIE family protein phosphatase [Candidatus Merdivicinus intestinigallinarum]